MELKDKLNAFLLDEDAHCLLLDGPWGVGKTYEVDRWRESIKDYKVIKLSLFGISSVEELNSLALNSESLFNRFKSYLKKINQDVNVGVGPVTVSAPIIGIVANLVKPKHSKKEKYLFIIDDVERKDSNLKIADIFGFVDSLSKENTKVVLITNEKKIYDKDLAGFKEKIVQYEHHLTKPSEEAIKTIFGTNKKIPESIEIDNLRTLKYVKRIVNSLKNDISSVLVKTIFLCSLFIKENKYSREDYFVNYERDARSIIPFIDQSKREKELVRIEAKLNELKKENKNGVFYLIENIKLLNLLNEVKENKIHDFVAEVYNYIATDDYSSLNEIQVPLKESTFKKIDEKGAYIFLSDNPNKEYSNIMNTFADIFKTDDYNLLDAFRNMGVAMAVNESLAKHDNFSLAAEKRVLKACVIPVAKYIFYNVSSEEEHVGLEQPFIYNKKEWLETAKDKVFREYCSVFNSHFRQMELNEIDELKNKMIVARNVFDFRPIDFNLLKLDNIFFNMIRREAKKPSKRITENDWHNYHKIARFINDEKGRLKFDKSIELIKELSKKKGIIGYRYKVLYEQYFNDSKKDL